MPEYGGRLYRQVAKLVNVYHLPWTIAIQGVDSQAAAEPAYYGCMVSEPWLRGPIPGVHPLISPILRSFEQAREDLAKFTKGLTPEQLWASPGGFGSAGFHIRHIAGSTERLMTYLQNRELTAEQMLA